MSGKKTLGYGNLLALFLVTLGSGVCLVGCEENVVNAIEASLNQQFRLKMGSQAHIDNESLTVKFAAVIEDSRCPIEVDCVWAGNAKITLDLNRPDISATGRVLNTYLEPTSTSFMGYFITLKALHPWPSLAKKTNPSDYVATLVVTKLDG